MTSWWKTQTFLPDRSSLCTAKTMVKTIWCTSAFPWWGVKYYNKTRLLLLGRQNPFDAVISQYLVMKREIFSLFGWVYRESRKNKTVVTRSPKPFWCSDLSVFSHEKRDIQFIWISLSRIKKLLIKVKFKHQEVFKNEELNLNLLLHTPLQKAANLCNGNLGYIYTFVWRVFNADQTVFFELWNQIRYKKKCLNLCLAIHRRLLILAKVKWRYGYIWSKTPIQIWKEIDVRRSYYSI